MHKRIIQEPGSGSDAKVRSNGCNASSWPLSRASVCTFSLKYMHLNAPRKSGLGVPAFSFFFTSTFLVRQPAKMGGLLLSDHYEFHKPSTNDMNIASIAWGFSLGVSIFAGTKAAKQTIKSWKRGTRTNIYLILVWMEWTSSVIMSAITWLYLRQYIPPGFPVFFVIGMSPSPDPKLPRLTYPKSFFGLSRSNRYYRLSSTESRSSWSTDIMHGNSSS